MLAEGETGLTSCFGEETVKMRSIQALVFTALFTKITSMLVTGASKCEPLRIKACRSLNYNMTSYPNFAHHRTQYEADLTIRAIAPLLNSKCSPDLLYLACSYYAPFCAPIGGVVPPCRSLCKRVKRDCMPVMTKIYGKFDWPSVWDCRKLPRRKRTKVCFGRPQNPKRNNSNTAAFYLR